MEFIKNAATVISSVASIAWSILSIASSGNPAAALVVIAAGVAWFAGIWAIIGSFAIA